MCSATGERLDASISQRSTTHGVNHDMGSIRLLALGVALLAVACGAPASSADAGLEPLSEDAGTAAAVDAGPSPWVKWTVMLRPMSFTTDKSFRAAYTYDFDLAGADAGEHLLFLNRCVHLANTTETCMTRLLDIHAQYRHVLVDMDPGSYRNGFNRYRFELQLKKGDVVVARDEIALELTVQNCTQCQ